MPNFFLHLILLWIVFLLTEATTADNPQFARLFGSPLGPPLSSLSPRQKARLYQKFLPAFSGSIVIKLEKDTAYACPSSYTYYSYDDALNNKIQNCNRWKSRATYRIMGGGSVSGCDKNCQVQPQNTKVLKKAVCVKSYVENLDYLKTYYGGCPTGSSRISYVEALIYRNNPPFEWPFPVTAGRVGFLGSIQNSIYEDAPSEIDVEEYDPQLYNSSVCVNRTITEVKIVDSGEDICGEGKTLLTLAEAYVRQKALCELLEPYETARLSGGGSMDGSGYECAIRDTDRRVLKSALCADQREVDPELRKNKSSLISWLSS